MRRAPPLTATLLALAACGEPVADDHFANGVATERAAPAPAATEAVPVRIGEFGPNFAACSAAGTTRHLSAGSSLAVRTAPFDSAAETGAITAGTRFFVCTRSHDQKWLGIVFDPSGVLSESCAVSAPAPRARAYAGPCKSGWVSSAFAKLIAGEGAPTTGQAEAKN